MRDLGGHAHGKGLEGHAPVKGSENHGHAHRKDRGVHVPLPLTAIGGARMTIVGEETTGNMSNDR